tara:strand:- start:7865 stop:8257 length:393 start_codon:yes stop_codon:yes gene_type:complete
MILSSLIGPIANLAGTWLQAKVDTKAAETKMKVSAAEAKSQILMSQCQSEANWEAIMAQGSTSSWKDEYITILMSLPIIICFTGEAGRDMVFDGFAALDEAPDWFIYTWGCVVAASFGIRGATQYFGNKK